MVPEIGKKITQNFLYLFVFFIIFVIIIIFVISIIKIVIMIIIATVIIISSIFLWYEKNFVLTSEKRTKLPKVWEWWGGDSGNAKIFF